MHAGVPGPYGSEAPFVLGCARRPGAQAPVAELRALIASSGFAWDRVLEFAVDHDIAPLFGRGVDEVRLDLPVAIAEELTGIERSTQFRNVQLSQLLIELMGILSTGGIQAVTFKGPALAAMLYGNVGLRTSGDIDLLVVRDDLVAAAELLETSGSLRRDPEAGARRPDGSVVLHDPELGIDIDLESDLGAGWYYSRPVDSVLLDRAVPVDVAGRSAPSLAVEDLLQAVALRGGHRLWGSWKRVCDVADLLRAADDLDWDRVEGAARDLDHLRTLDVGLRLARDHLGAQLPMHVAQRIDADPVVASTAKLVARVNSGRATMTGLRAHRTRWRCRQQWSNRARYAGHAVRSLGRAAI